MPTPNPEHLEFMMYLDGAIRQVEEQMPQNELVKSLKSKFFQLAGDEFDRSVLKELHEQTIENILKKQADGFYNNFRKLPESTLEELVGTYVEMEHQVRRNNFEMFSLCVYKQIECIVNHCLTYPRLIKLLDSIRKNKVYREEWTAYWDQGQPVTKIFDYGVTIQRSLLNIKNSNTKQYFTDSDYDLFFQKSEAEIFDTLINLDFTRRFKLILYVVKHESKVTESQFRHDIILFESIKQSRHLAHGGKISSIQIKLTEGIIPDDKEQTFINALNNTYLNYAHFRGFLADFIQNVPKFLDYK